MRVNDSQVSKGLCCFLETVLFFGDSVVPLTYTAFVTDSLVSKNRNENHSQQLKQLFLNQLLMCA